MIKVKKRKILLLPGDGIGPEVIEEALKIIKSIESISGDKYDIKMGEVGGRAYDKYGDPLPDNTIDLIENCNSVLFGAVGGPKWDDLDSAFRPEMGILKIRKKFEKRKKNRKSKKFEKRKIFEKKRYAPGYVIALGE